MFHWRSHSLGSTGDSYDCGLLLTDLLGSSPAIYSKYGYCLLMLIIIMIVCDGI